ncbi:cardiolipin synthase [Halanaerobacter jeridensis]|uniref:Cardiolipin synthase n=1 Tax=Halanaerobacter jeridensis TaxID=706427 RepID=A0A939BNU5_9FIRM|nr:cardiolipin synthase [Halanaerobacter jeridensis]MBM7556087.1 cardiolipin synthase [Halanaerobacter jeridensis]
MKFIKNVLFRRSTFLAVAILAQIVILIGVIAKFNDYFVFFYMVSTVLSIIIVGIILNNDMHPVYKLAWIIPILLFPVFGGVFYLLFGGSKLGKRSKKKLKSITEETENLLDKRDSILEEIKSKNKFAAQQARYIQNYAKYPPYYNTESRYLKSGEEHFKELKKQLRKAEKYIFLEYFIIAEGEMWDTILDILIEKAESGVEVRLIYDDLGCLQTLPYKYQEKLKKLGIKVAIFNPLFPILSIKHNNRDHRKIVVIDGETAFTGGINLADEYINKIDRFGHWKDSGIMLQGAAVWNMTVMFLSMWQHLTGVEENINEYKADIPSAQKSKKDGYIQPFADSPLDNEAVGEMVYLNLITKAEDYIYITTPYLILDNEMITALTSAAKAGVDVRIITPHIPDKWYVHLVTRSYYEILMASGVKVYEYQPGFIHSKTYVADDNYGGVGTINMDYRSLFLHFECGVWLYKCSTIQDMKDDFETTLEKCKKITKEDLEEQKWYKSLVGSVLRVFAPLM